MSMPEDDRQLTYEELLKIQEEEQARREAKHNKVKSSSVEEIEIVQYPVAKPKEAGQASSNSGFEKGAVFSSSTPKPER